MSPASRRHKLSPSSFPLGPFAAHPVRQSRYRIPKVPTNLAAWQKPRRALSKVIALEGSGRNLPTAAPQSLVFGESSQILACRLRKFVASFFRVPEFLAPRRSACRLEIG